MKLTIAQFAALQYIEEYAKKLCGDKNDELANVLAMCNIGETAYNKAVDSIREHACVGLQFHPDRIAKSGKTVAQGLLEEGFYKNQFETHVSNGGLHPTPSGARAGWEDILFGGAFRRHYADLSERPKYGALHLMLHADGPCPRYGSCYFLLKPAVAERCTFTYMDSHRNPFAKGTLQIFEPLMQALMVECFERKFVLGTQGITPGQLVEHLLQNLKKPIHPFTQQSPSRNLNHYIEAQVHGPVSLLKDVEILVADPCYKNTSIEQNFLSLCDKYQIQLYWHKGFKMPADSVPPDFRGPTMPSLAQRIARDANMNAYAIGLAAQDLKLRPENWRDRGSYETVLQELKLLWHVVVEFGGSECPWGAGPQQTQ